MKSLAGTLVFIALFFSITIPALGILQGQDVKTMILTGLSLSFATIPEELPIIITMVLGLGSYTLSKNKFLVKKLKVAETLGNTTVIVTDKTGTITQGQLKIVATYPKNREREIIGSALYASSDLSLSPLDLEIKKRASELRINDSSREVFRKRDFGKGKKTKTVVERIGNDYKLIMSGAPEEIFICCRDINPSIKDELLKETSKGRRVISIASKKLPAIQIDSDFSALETDLECIGLISFEDSPRPGVKETIARATKAGIRTIMVTGDHPQTAKYIAEEVGISSSAIVVDKELDTLSDEKLQEAVKVVSVFARATPEHKFRIIHQ
jgi:Ca2+-transporting ATPase